MATSSVDLVQAPAIALQDSALPLRCPPAELDRQNAEQRFDQSQSEPPLHVAMVPYPLQGHINPMLEFAQALIAHHNVIVSFINIRHHHARMQKALSPDQLRGKLRLLCMDIDGIPAGRFNFSDIAPQLMDLQAALSLGMAAALKQVLQSSTDGCPPVSCVCFGSFCHWAHATAVDLGLPSFFFWTQSAAVFSIYYHTPLLQAHGFFPYTGNDQAPQDESIGEHDRSHEHTSHRLVSYVPGVPPLQPSSFPALLRINDVSDLKYSSMIKEQFLILSNCQGVIINSFEELEKDCHRVLEAELGMPVLFVGPLIPSDTFIGASLAEKKVECMDWLDHQKKQSVFYVSFGSLLQLSAEDAESIAIGIKASRQPFIWVLRPTASMLDVSEILPKGFMDDIKGQGLIIPWAPQLQVLSHPSIGAFLTHCGWNSTIESISMGVPTITCAIFSDQLTNATYLCDFWKIGMALTRHDDGMLRSSDVARAIRTVLLDREGEKLQKKAKELQEVARRAKRAGDGSSFIHMERFVQFMRNCNKNIV